ncbi:MAG: hypothetical protein QF707_04510 [Candidatus Poseidoniaceae archaeon]|nr:hypothetical protein [Candidatus Poseidoniaceae archaeon]
MRTPRVAIVAVVVMFLAPLSGCVGSDMPEWGNDSGEISVTVVDSKVTINSKLTEGGTLHSMSATKTGCDNDTNEPFVVEGWLSQFHHYPMSADEAGDDDDLLMGVTTVAIIELMSFDMALEVSPANAPRVDVKDFGDPATGGKANPLAPRTLGEPKLDKDTGFMTLGLIPANENILFGLNAFDWHIPVRLSGYFLTKEENSTLGNSLNIGGKRPDDVGCRLSKGPGGEAFLVEEIQLGEDTIISMSGESSDEWVNGDVPIIGRWVYMISLMAVGGGGAFVLFGVSTAMQRKSAAAAASMLLGAERVSKAKGIKKEIKDARDDGLEITKTKRSKGGASSATPKVEDEDIKGFSLDNILESGPSISSSTVEMGGGSVLVTDEAIDMDEKLEDMQAPSGLVDSIIGGQQPVARGPPSGGSREQAAPVRESSPPRRERTPPRSEQQARSRGPPKRAARQDSREQQPQEAPKRRRPSMTDDDDFSDFSFD